MTDTNGWILKLFLGVLGVIVLIIGVIVAIWKFRERLSKKEQE